MGRFSGFRLVKEAFGRHLGWERTLTDVQPRPRYQMVIIGGGGHGLSTAYYLARNHGITDVCVVEKGPIGLGNVGRNTTIIRSNYFSAPNIRFYEHSLKLWEGLERDINYNAMVSQRGTLNLAHSEAQRDLFIRRGNLMRMEGVDAEMLTREQVKALVPLIQLDDTRFPVLAGFLQPRGGTVRHDAVAWGYARAAAKRGVDIVQNTPVTGIRREGGRVVGVETARGFIGADKVLIAVAGHSSDVAAMAGLRLPIETHVLQAFVTESIKPVLDCVVTFGAGHFYISQSDKGGLVFGGSTDGYTSYAQRGHLPVVEEVLSAGLTLMPGLGRARVLRQWGGVMDMTMDSTPIISPLPLEGLYMNGGWCYGGFKAIPAGGWTTAHMLATGRPHPLTEHMALDRFAKGLAVDERGTGPYPWAH